MLANYYHFKNKPHYATRVDLMRLTLKPTGTMKKSVRLFYLVLLMALSSVKGLYAQTMSLTTFPQNICFKDFTSTTVTFSGLPAGITVDSLLLDYNSDGKVDVGLKGPSTFFNTQYVYPVPGPYTITAVAKLSNGVLSAPQTFSGVVYRLPIPDFGILNSNIQCFRGNKVEFVNKSIKTDNKIIRAIFVWGDATNAEFLDPFYGQQIDKSYTFSGQFLITLRVIDSVGCQSDTVSVPGGDKEITIKNNMQVDFDVLGARGCFKSKWMLDNVTAGVNFAGIRSYTWDFGDGQTTTRSAPWNLPVDERNFDTISHNYTLSGSFYPALVIEDTTGCIDSLRLSPSSGQVPENINFEFNITPTVDKSDTIPRRDSICYGNQSATVYFRQTPVDFAGPGDFLWNFGNPQSGPQNFNTSDWWPMHTYVNPGPPGVPNRYIVSLRILVAPCDTTMRDTIDILGAQSRIELSPLMIAVPPSQKTQCIINQVVEFPNTSVYYKSDHIWRIWDFGDDVAPKCTSYLIPNTGWPLPGGWEFNATPPYQQLNNSTGYWMQNGVKYPGKRIDCNFSLDTLPAHRYTDWNVVYNWYRYGHDFMPWDFNRYTRNPADTIGGAKFWVMDYDTLYWGKPVYLNPSTGAFSLLPGTWTDPFTNQTMPWPRIDTIESNNQPQDLQMYHTITMNRGTPDPFSITQGDYAMFPLGHVVDPKADMFITYRSKNTGILRTYNYGDSLPSQDANKTLYRYIFDREVQKCITVSLTHIDSANHMAGDYQDPDDFLLLDPLDCEDPNGSVQLALVRPDARGMGKSGKECPGSFASGQNGIKFNLASVDDLLGKFPGVNPDCGQSFILLNHDSMADRLDNTPCVLDGFIDWQGGITAGGIERPIFTSFQDWADPMQFWTSPGGTVTWYHYGPDAPAAPGLVNPIPGPADQSGLVTVGLVIGAGNFPNTCISDTVWYHNFFFFKELNAAFYVDPTYDMNGVATNGACKLYCHSDEVTFVYLDSAQDSVSYSKIDWGDNTITVDTFYFAPGVNDGHFVNGARRVRYNISYGPCGNGPEVITSMIEFPNGFPGVDVDTLWWDNYTFRLYHFQNNPTGSLQILGPNLAGDSVLINECSKQYWLAYKDTLKQWYRMELRDRALMFLPVKHRYSSSSWEDNCKQSSTAPREVVHTMVSMKDCRYLKFDTKLLVRGVIDTVFSRNSDLEFDTIFCALEEVHFYDSVRYWRPDCSLTSDLNPNRNWETLDPLANPWGSMNIDTIDYWRRYQDNPDLQWPNGVFVEKLKWYFGDGDSATGSRPVHKYKAPGKYTVTLVSSDKNYCFDTTYCYVYISEPQAVPVLKTGAYNCGDIVTFFNQSYMEARPGIEQADSINKNYWWFGERFTDTLRFDGQDLDTAKWNYRRNGLFKIKLVATTYQGCSDTGWTEVYISGPRPKIALLGDTIGCSPFKVRVLNLQDTDPFIPGATATKVTQVNWGTPVAAPSKSIQQYDTLEYVYYDTGTFYIFADADDNDPMQDNKDCHIVRYPDTIDGNQPPIRIHVRTSYPANVSTSLTKVCVDQQFDVINGSDSINYTEYRFSLLTGDTLTELASYVKDNSERKFSLSLDSVGKYLFTVDPTKFKIGVPECKLQDTVAIEVVKPTAGWSTLDSSEDVALKTLFNTSFGSGEYTWTAYRASDMGIISTVDKVQADSNWEYNFGTDTGDVIICIKAYTLDPQKPICVDEYCDTISYRFVVNYKIFNVFTPGDNNGENDVFDIVIEGETEYDLVIYNRWGTKVFESKDSKKDWNGKNMNDGTDCPEGTYYFVFKYALRNGQHDTEHGTVTLLRPKE